MPHLPYQSQMIAVAVKFRFIFAFRIKSNDIYKLDTPKRSPTWKKYAIYSPLQISNCIPIGLQSDDTFHFLIFGFTKGEEFVGRSDTQSCLFKAGLKPQAYSSFDPSASRPDFFELNELFDEKVGSCFPMSPTVLTDEFYAKNLNIE